MNFLRYFTIVTLVALVSCSKPEYVEITGYAQGGVYSVKLNLAGRDGKKVRTTPEKMKEDMDSILLAIDNSLSGYNKGSLLSRYNAGEDIVPDSIFLDIYARGRAFYFETEGALDVASAPLFDLWGFGFKNNEFPDSEQVECIKGSCGMDRMGDDVMLSRPAMLNFNAIAQGYSCDLIAGYLHSKGVCDMLINIGGEMFCDGRNPNGQPWKIGIDRPFDGNDVPGADIQEVFLVKDVPCGVVTSGNYRKFYVREGKKYSHTVDPRTGYPVEHSLLSATLIAPDATSADAYATYCMVIGLQEAKAFVMSRDDLEACLVYEEDGNMLSWASDGFVLE